MRPLARREELLLRELPDELIVYDLRRHQAHCLNHTAARVFRRADGTRTVAEIAGGLEGEPRVREAMVRLALDQLAAAGLLEGEDATSLDTAARVEAAPGRSRRELLQRVGAGAALLLPAVVSVLAPTPADAASCLDSCPPPVEGQPCKCLNVPQTDCGQCQLDGSCTFGGSPC